MNFAEKLRKLGACGPAIDWVGDRTLERAWAECPRGDWMLWLAGRAGVDRRPVVLAACAYARTVLHLVPAGEDRPRMAIETAEAWVRGEATIEHVMAAADAGMAAARDATRYAVAARAAAAARDATRYAVAARAAAEAAAYAAWAADADYADYAARAAAWAARAADADYADYAADYAARAAAWAARAAARAAAEAADIARAYITADMVSCVLS